MARSGIQYPQVKQAAVTLLGRGLHPSIQRVRELLGTGSHSTISAHLKRWQEELADKPQSTPLPPAVPATLAQPLEQLWNTATTQAQQTYVAFRNEAQEKVDNAQRERDESLQAIQKVTQQLQTTQDALAEAQAKLVLMDTALVRESERRTHAETAIEQADQRALQAEAQVERTRAETQTQLRQMERVLENLREDTRQQSEQARQRLELECERSEATETHLMQLIDELRQEQRREREAFEKTRRTWQQQQHRYRKRLQSMGERLKNNDQQIASLEQTLERCSAQIDGLHTERLQLQRKQARMAHLIETFRGKLDTAGAQNRGLRRRLEELEADAKVALGQATKKEVPDKSTSKTRGVS